MYSRLMICLSAASLSLMAGVFQPAQAAENDAGLLEAVIVQNDAAIKKLGSLYVAYHWDQTSYPAPVNTDLIKIPGGETKESAQAELWVNGDCFHQVVHRKITWKETGEERVDQLEVLFDGNQFVFFNSNRAEVLRYISKGQAGISSQAKLHLPSWPMRSILDYGLKGIFASLQEHYDSKVQKENFNWTIEEEKSAEEGLVRIKSARASDTPWRQFDILVDARKDYMIREWTAYNKKGQEYLHLDVDFRRLPEGPWFPDVIAVRQPENAVLSMKVDAVKVLDPDNRKPFGLDSMLFDKDNTLMLDIMDDGQHQVQRAWWLNEWVPLDALPLERLTAFQTGRKRVTMATDAK